LESITSTESEREEAPDSSEDSSDDDGNSIEPIVIHTPDFRNQIKDASTNTPITPIAKPQQPDQQDGPITRNQKKEQEAKRIPLLILGDSHLNYWSTQENLKKTLEAKLPNHVNAAISGAGFKHVTDLIQHNNPTYTNNEEQKDPKKPKTTWSLKSENIKLMRGRVGELPEEGVENILVSLGTNEFNEFPHNTIPKRFRQLLNVLKTIRSKYPTAAIYILQIPPRKDDFYRAKVRDFNALNTKTDDFNTHIKMQITNSEGALYDSNIKMLDLPIPPTDMRRAYEAGSNNAKYMRDEIHLNYSTHKKLLEKIVEKVNL